MSNLDDDLILAGWFGSMRNYLCGVVPAEMPASWAETAFEAPREGI